MIRKSITAILCIALSALVSQVYAQGFYSDQFSPKEVTLLDGPFKHARDLNIQVLLEYDVDRLLQPFLKQAGLEPKGEAFPNWAGLDGHVGGHYLSALAMAYASTGNQECKERMDYMLSELKRCQDASPDGYIGGVPGSNELWPAVKAGDIRKLHALWCPWYNIHKIFAGLRDGWAYGGSELSKGMFLKLCDWGISIFDCLDDKQMEDMLSQEHGGINEVYADAYVISGDKKYLDAAKRLTHHDIFDNMLAGNDILDNKHANTQVPKIVGYARVAELDHNPDYLKASEFFWDRVVNHRSIAFGGNSRREHFPAVSDYGSYLEEREGPESCNTYNMLKLSMNLYRLTDNVEYLDFYEHALYNHILSTQHPVHGGYVYFTSARPSHYRVYSQPNSGMWCCVGTGMENHCKYEEFIYTHAEDCLHINLFIASELNWDEKGFSLKQSTDFPSEEGSTITITSPKSKKMKIAIRYPLWVAEGQMKVLMDGKDYAQDCKPGSYVTIDRKWKKGDIIQISTPMTMRIERLENVPDYIAIKRGPILLGVKTNTRDMPGLIADDGRWAHIASGPYQSAFEDAPYIVADDKTILKELSAAIPVPGKPFHFTVPGLFNDKFKNAELEPFYGIHDTRYSIYYLCMDQNRYQEYIDEMEAQEKARMELDARTIDYIQLGEQQPEIDHRMRSERSVKGNNQGENYRQAMGGWFEYEMETKGLTGLSLMIRVWGNETGLRSFDILVDGKKIATENIAGKWNVSKFQNAGYPIPSDLLKGKDIITVRFQAAAPRNIVGGIYMVRLLKP